MSDVVIGTAGHIDHGKTMLVKALSGIDTDRLKEEKNRGITIEPGFAHLTLPSGRKAALVDVPGHERFIKNMLAGVTGIDMALLVIAADESVMPQTREHLDILRLLDINKIIVVISKIDLVEEEFLVLIKEDISDFLHETHYRDAPVVFVSAKTGKGIQQLREVIDSVISRYDIFRKKYGPARLPLDRVFSIQGFGTVVTGTLFNGVIKTGDSLEIAIKNKIVRVRNLQMHNKDVTQAIAGQRVAINLAGVEAGELQRGDVLATPGWLHPSSRIDLLFRLLPSYPRPLQQQTRVRFHQGTRETLGRVVLLDREELLPGEQAFIQILLEQPVALLRGDNCIIRSYSPAHTIGGGKIAEPFARKYKKHDAEILEQLNIKISEDSEKLTELYLEQKKVPVSFTELAWYLYIDKKYLATLLEDMAQNKIISLTLGEEKHYLSAEVVRKWEELISREIKKRQKEFPLEQGLNKEYLRGRLFREWSVKEFNALVNYWIEKRKFSLLNSQYLVLYGDIFCVEETWRLRIDKIKAHYLKSGWQIPDWNTVKAELKLTDKQADQIMQYLLRTRQLVPIDDSIYICDSLLEETKHKLSETFSQRGEFSVAEVRDLLDSTRKIVVPLLEYLDKTGFSQRKGQGRVLTGKNYL